MKCSACDARGHVIGTRQTADGVTRRYSCICGERWTTHERRTLRVTSGQHPVLPEVADLRLRLDYIQTQLVALLEGLQ